MSQNQRPRGAWGGGRAGMGRSGRNAGQSGGRGGGANGGGNAPLNAPTGPSAQRGHGGYQGGRAGGQSGGRGGFGAAAGGRGGGQLGDANNQGNTIPTPPGPRPLDPALYRAPRGDYTDQSAVGSVGINPKYVNCLHCNEPKGPDHPDFVDCLAPCGYCRSNHPGQACDMMYCSKKWWKDHLGRVPDNVQLRPTEPERQQLAQGDQYFANFPKAIHPQDKEGPMLSLKRTFYDTEDEHEREVKKFSDDLHAKKRKEAEKEADRHKEAWMKEELRRRAAEGDLESEKRKATSAQNQTKQVQSLREQDRARFEADRAKWQQVLDQHKADAKKAQAQAIKQAIAEYQVQQTLEGAEQLLKQEADRGARAEEGAEDEVDEERVVVKKEDPEEEQRERFLPSHIKRED